MGMKRLFGKKAVTVLLASMLLLGACSSNTGGNKGVTEPVNNGASPAPSETTEIDPLGKYDPPITVSVMGETGTNVLFAAGESVDDNIMTKTFSDQLGIEFVNKWVSNAANSAEKLNLSINTNDIPDLTKVDATQLARLVDQDQVADLTEVYEKYASPLLKQTLEYGGGEGLVAATSDGKLYGLPIPNDYYENVSIMYIRQDWLDELKMSAPTTIEELAKVAEAFATMDPDGNNKQDTYGFAMDNDLGLGFDGIASAFHAYRAIWVELEDGSLAYGSVQPEMKDALTSLSELYASGALDREFGAKDWGKTADDIGAGKGGIYFGAFWQPLYPLSNTKTHTPSSEWKAYPVPAGADGVVRVKRNTNVFSWVVARKDMTQPEALIKSMNLWAEMSVEGGSLNDLYYNDIQGSEKYKGMEVHQYAKPYFFDDPGKNMTIGKQFQAAIAADDDHLVTHPDGIWKWEAYKNDEPNGWAFMKYLSESQKVLEDYGDGLVNQAFLGAPTATMAKRLANLNKLELETFTKIIMGKSSPDEFDSFVEQWYKLGGEAITKEVNEWAATRK